jgi:hypothetical protein
MAPSSRLPRSVEFALLILLLLTIALATGGRYLMQRKLWMDEVHSWLLIQEPSTSRSLQALADGFDYNPPTYVMLARQLRYLPGGITESSLRWFSLSLMLLAVLGTFVLLRRRCPFLVCLASVLMMVSSAPLIHQASEIRFYPLWCATCAWLCVALDVQTIKQRWLVVLCNCAAVLLAVVMTTTHYFGILTLSLICAGAMLAPNPARGRRRFITFVAITGAVCLSCCLPFLIGQRAALTRPTWVSPATIDDSLGFLTAMFPLIPVLACSVAFVISLALSQSKKRLADSASTTALELTSANINNIEFFARHLAPCLLLALMPLVIVLLSWTVQPALVVRYAVTGILGYGAVFAILMSRCGRGLQMLLVVVGGLCFLTSVSSCSDQWRDIDQTRDKLVSILKSLPADGPIVFEDRTISMPVLHLHPELQARCSLIDFRDGQLSGDSNLRIVQRDVGHRIEKWYPEYTMRSIDSLEDESTFYVVPYVETQTADLIWPTGYQKSEISPAVERYTASDAN